MTQSGFASSIQPDAGEKGAEGTSPPPETAWRDRVVRGGARSEGVPLESPRSDDVESARDPIGCVESGGVRDIGLAFRKLSDLFLAYRHQPWARLSDEEQYHIENNEWSLINFCNDFASLGIHFSPDDAEALIRPVKRRMEHASRQVAEIIDAGEPETRKVIALGTWSLKLGAAILCGNAPEVSSLLSYHAVAPDRQARTHSADPAIAREIGLNFARLSDFILRYRYQNWNRLADSEDTGLEDIQLTLLNYNSNFGGLGIPLDEGRTDELLLRLRDEIEGLIDEMERLDDGAPSTLEAVMGLCRRALGLGSAITMGNVAEIERTLDRWRADAAKRVGMEIGLKVRRIASLLLRFRYGNMDALTKRQAYCLENLEFSLTNFNSDFAVFGIGFTAARDRRWVAAIRERLDVIIERLAKAGTPYPAFLAQGTAALKLCSAILTEERPLIKKMLAAQAGDPPLPERAPTDGPSRETALRVRAVAGAIFAKSYGNGAHLSEEEMRRISNIQWTLMNFASNFSVLGIELSGKGGNLLSGKVLENLDRKMKGIENLSVARPEGRKKLSDLGMDAMKLAATITTGDGPSVKAALGGSG